MTETFVVDQPFKRLDVFLASVANKSRSHVKNLVQDGLVTVNGKVAKVSQSLSVGDEVVVDQPQPKTLDLSPQNLPLDIVYQDKDIAVINKAQGVTVHAGGGTLNNTLVNALLYHLDSLSSINGVIRPGIVHRIDKDTSGLLVVAKNDVAHLSLSRQIAQKTAGRIYVALLEGVLKQNEGQIETFIARSPKDRKMMAVATSGRKALTYYKVLCRYQKYTLCQFKLATGRTHQIRVHAKHLGHPIVGDKVYGFKTQTLKADLKGQLLHAKTLVLTHPTTGETLTFNAPLPDYFQAVLNKLENTKI